MATGGGQRPCGRLVPQAWAKMAFDSAASYFGAMLNI